MLQIVKCSTAVAAQVLLCSPHVQRLLLLPLLCQPGQQVARQSRGASTRWQLPSQVGEKLQMGRSCPRAWVPAPAPGCLPHTLPTRGWGGTVWQVQNGCGWEHGAGCPRRGLSPCKVLLGQLLAKWWWGETTPAPPG